MSETENRPVVIVGAGIAGLTLGSLLVKGGKSVILVEREKQLGGLARSFRYDGFTFDIGPHRFHTDDQDVLAFIKEVFKEEHIVISRKSGVYMFGKYFDWPLAFSSLFRMPPIITIRAFFDLLGRRREITNPESFTDYTISKYGKTLYQAFFKYYTEKFIRIPCEEVHVDWATAGINRAVIDKRVKADSLGDLVKGVLLPQKVDTKFIYPKSPGVDHFCEKLANIIRSNGGRILTDTTVSKIDLNGERVTEIKLSDGETIPVEKLVWSGELHSLGKMLNVDSKKLRYLSMICYNIAVNGQPLKDYQWNYYGDRKISINRISVPNLFNSANAPEGHSGINVEITCMEGDNVWQNPNSMINIVKKDLVDTKLLRKSGDIEEIWIERIRNTYPIYDIGYHKNLAEVEAGFDRYDGLMRLGRCGTFWYNNMDHSIKMAMDFASHILTGSKLGDKSTYFPV